MSTFFEEKNSKEKKNNAETLRQIWAKTDIRRSADNSRKKLDDIADADKFEQQLQENAEKLRQEREEFRRTSSRRTSSSAKTGSGEENEALKNIYEARAALQKTAVKPHRKESFLHRTYRLTKGLSAVRKDLRSREYVTCEQTAALRRDVFRDAWQPVCQAFDDAADTLWDFLCRLGRDFTDVILFLADIFITIAYYAGSFGLFLWDILWDIRFAMEQNKRKLFLYFSSVISVAAVILIVTSSVSAYEYSYYGRKLGIAKSKQDVYRTIDVLGDKLSKATGANINIDVERDMKFTKIYGFKLDVDSSDEILNTLTYMKDLQAEAFVVCVNGRKTVYMNNEVTAQALIDRIKGAYTQPKDGVEYTSVNFRESVTIQSEKALLGDIWNADDAFRYLTTGTVRALGEDDEAHPLVHVCTVETATYEESVKFEDEFVENSKMYADEKQLISAGKNGTDRVVAEITRVNGEEQERVIVSTTRTTNPINAVYYKGTKPIPQRTGTGTFIFPLKCKYYKSAYFHEDYGVAGVSKYHQGIDYACPTGSKIYASDGGVVTFAGYNSGYGYMIKIDHGGLYETIYGHCSKLLVNAGDHVYQGQNIALVGSTGVSTGPHLHFEVRYKGEAINPESVLP